MNFKKNYVNLFKIVTGLAFTASVVLVPSLIVKRNENVITTSNYIKADEIDLENISTDTIFKDVMNDETISNIFRNNKNDVGIQNYSSLNKLNYSSTNERKNDVEDANAYIKNKIESAMEHIKKYGIDSTFVDNYFAENTNQYKEIFDGNFESLNYVNKNNDLQNINHSSSLTARSYSSNNFTDLVENLRVSRWTFVSISATAAVASAGLWAAAWWFGITIPAAIQTSIIAAVCGAVASGINIALVSVDESMSGMERGEIVISSIVTLGWVLFKIVYPVCVTANAVLTVSSWAFPLVLSVIPVTVWIMTSLAYYGQH